MSYGAITPRRKTKTLKNKSSRGKWLHNRERGNMSWQSSSTGKREGRAFTEMKIIRKQARRAAATAISRRSKVARNKEETVEIKTQKNTEDTGKTANSDLYSESWKENKKFKMQHGKWSINQDFFSLKTEMVWAYIFSQGKLIRTITCMLYTIKIIEY